MVLDVMRSEMAMDFGSTKWNRCLMRGLPMDSPRTSLGLLKTVRIALDQNGPCQIACMQLFDMRSMNDVWRIKLLLFV